LITILIIAFLVAAGVAGVVVFSRRGASNWNALIGEAAARLSGRASPPELRALVEGTTINVKIAGPNRAVGHAKLEDGSELIRIFIGWDVAAIPQGLEHFPEINLPVAYTFAGTMTTRANDKQVAERFLERGARDLIDLRDSTHSESLALTVRGGHIEIALTGLDQSADSLEKLARTTVALGRRLSFEERSAPALPAERRCVACMDVGGDDWVNCEKCNAAYHRACFAKAGGCVAPGCT
jgi:hypothetical protein